MPAFAGTVNLPVDLDEGITHRSAEVCVMEKRIGGAGGMLCVAIDKIK